VTISVGESEGEDEKIRLVVVRGGFVSCIGFTVGVNEVVGEILGLDDKMEGLTVVPYEGDGEGSVKLGDRVGGFVNKGAFVPCVGSGLG